MEISVFLVLLMCIKLVILTPLLTEAWPSKMIKSLTVFNSGPALSGCADNVKNVFFLYFEFIEICL